MKTVQVCLRRGPIWKRVAVGQITVAGFLELLRLLVSKSSEVRLQADRDITAEDLIRALREPEFNALADSVVKGQPAGFFSRWLSLRNVRALYEASGRVNNWGRIFSCVDWTAKKKRRGSLVGDVQTICRIFPGLDPMTVQNEWPMEDFLTFVDAMNLEAADSEPEPMSVMAMASLSGAEVIH